MTRVLRVFLDIDRTHVVNGRALPPASALDAGAAELAAWCRREEIGMAVLSDDQDVHVRPLLGRAGIPEVPFFANACHTPDRPAAAEEREGSPFPFGNGECDRCGCCKRNIMLGMIADEDLLVYIGEGPADGCPAAYADIVFARGALQTWCRERNVSYYVYRDLHDVRRRLEELRERRTLRPRPRAVRARREAYLAEA